ncbi:MAG: hypothetical protein WCH65_08825 [bacterium]
MDNSTNVTVNNVDIFHTTAGMYSMSGTFLLSNARLFNNVVGIYGWNGISSLP